MGNAPYYKVIGLPCLPCDESFDLVYICVYDSNACVLEAQFLLQQVFVKVVSMMVCNIMK